MAFFSDPNPHYKTKIAENVGSGLGQGISNVIESKLNKMYSAEQRKGELIRAEEDRAIERKFLTDEGASANEAQAIMSIPDPKQRGLAIAGFFSQKERDKARNASQVTPGARVENAAAPEIAQRALQQEKPSDQAAPTQQSNTMVPEQPSKSPFQSALDAVQAGGTSGKGNEKEIALKERAQDFKENQATNAVLKELAQKYHEYNDVANIAKRAKKLLVENKKNWPGAFRGNLSGKAQALFERDPKVREYMTLSNEVVTAKAKTGKGVPSRARLLLEENSKANLNQPFQTQLAVWDRLLSDAEDKKKLLKGALSERNPQTGKYPTDLLSRTLEQELAHDVEDINEETSGSKKEAVSSLDKVNNPQNGDRAVNKKTGQVRVYSSERGEWVNE